MKTKVGVIGVGYWGIRHVQRFRDIEGVDIVAADLDEGRRKMAEEMYNAKTVSDYHEILNDPEIKAVTVCTPTNTHYDIVKELLEAGKHVMVEKPITEEVSQAEELIEIAKNKNLVLSVGHVFRFNDAVRKIKEMITNNEFGKIYILKLKWTNLETYSDEKTRNYSAANIGRNVIIDLGPHAFDIVNFLFDRDPDDVSCIGTGYRKGEEPEVVFINCRLKDTVINMELSWLTPIKQRWMELIGDKKSAFVHLLDQQVKVTEDGGLKDLEIVPNITILDELRHFLECIEEGKQPSNSGEVGKRTIQMIQITEKSLKEGKTFKFDWS